MAVLGDIFGDVLKSSLAAIDDLRQTYPNVQALLSVRSQLHYLIALDDGIEVDDSALENLTLGYLAVYPLAGILPSDLSKSLCDISQRVKRRLR